MIETHVCFYCYRVRDDGIAEILLLKRTKDRQIASDEWECGGGQVHENESFEAAARRHLFEKSKLRATHWRLIGCFEVKIEDKTVPGTIFSCKTSPNSAVKINPQKHTDYKWASLDDIKDIDFMSVKAKQEVTKLLMTQSRLW